MFSNTNGRLMMIRFWKIIKDTWRNKGMFSHAIAFPKDFKAYTTGTQNTFPGFHNNNGNWTTFPGKNVIKKETWCKQKWKIILTPGDHILKLSLWNVIKRRNWEHVLKHSLLSCFPYVARILMRTKLIILSTSEIPRTLPEDKN